MGQHDEAWPLAGVDEVGNREERLDLGGEFAGPRLSGRRRPLGKFGRVPRRLIFGRHVGPCDVERVSARENLTDLDLDLDLDRVRRRHGCFGHLLAVDPSVDERVVPAKIGFGMGMSAAKAARSNPNTSSAR